MHAGTMKFALEYKPVIKQVIELHADALKRNCAALLEHRDVVETCCNEKINIYFGGGWVRP